MTGTSSADHAIRRHVDEPSPTSRTRRAGSSRGLPPRSLGVGAGAVSTTYALTQVAERRPNTAATTAAATTLGVIAITVTVNEPANHQFTAGG